MGDLPVQNGVLVSLAQDFLAVVGSLAAKSFSGEILDGAILDGAPLRFVCAF